jgi:hypothetical protein
MKKQINDDANSQGAKTEKSSPTKTEKGSPTKDSNQGYGSPPKPISKIAGSMLPKNAMTENNPELMKMSQGRNKGTVSFKDFATTS